MKHYNFEISDFSVDYLFVNILYNTYLLRKEEHVDSLEEKNNNE